MNYHIHNFPQDCKEFEERYNINIVIHSYYARNKIDIAVRAKCAFKSCLTKYEYGCKNTSCNYYRDREPIFNN